MKNDGGAAFARPHSQIPAADGKEWGEQDAQDGMSLRVYACIKLKVPETGIDWLDEIIAKAEKRDLAGMALQGMMANTGYIESTTRAIAEWAYTAADAVLAEREKEIKP